jgi:hypothetical protein
MPIRRAPRANAFDHCAVRMVKKLDPHTGFAGLVLLIRGAFAALVFELVERDLESFLGAIS